MTDRRDVRDPAKTEGEKLAISVADRQLGEAAWPRPAEETALLRQAAEMAVLGYWVWDEVEDICVYCSETLARMNGVTVEAYMRDFAQMDGLLANVHPDDRERYAAVMMAARDSKSAYEIEFRDLAAAGRYRHLRERGEPVVDESGRLVRTVGTLQDITRQKESELALRQAKEDLEATVTERTARLHEANAALKQEIAEHERAREALRASEAQLLAFIEHCPAEIGIKDSDGRYVLINPVSEGLYKRPRDEIIGKLPHEIFAKDIADQLVAHDQEVLRGAEPSNREISGEIDGEHRSYMASKFPIKDASGQVVGLGAIAMDITEQKRTDEAVRESESRYRALFEDAPLPIFEEDWAPAKTFMDHLRADGITDVPGYFDANPAQIAALYRSIKPFDVSLAAVRLYRAESKADLRQAMLEAPGFDELSGYAQALVAFHGGASRFEYEADEIACDDTPMRTRIRAVIPPDSRRTWNRVLVTVEDITDRSRAEAELRSREAMLHQAHQVSRIGYWSVDHESQMLTISPEMAVLLGAEPGELETISDQVYLDRFVHDDDRDRVRRELAALGDHPWRFEVEYRVVTCDGQLRWFREVGESLADQSGGTVKEIGTIQDVTDQKTTEMHLQQAQKMEAVGQLTGGVAHDFNNLLGVMIGNAELLRADARDDDPLLAAIIRAGRRGAELTQRLLAFSRRQTLHPKPLDLGLLVGDMSALLRRTLGGRVEIKTRTAPDLWPALADAGQIENAILNLALNARDAMGDGGELSIEVANATLDHDYTSHRPDVAPGSYVRLMVSDTGEGMSDEVLAHASEPFFTTKDVGQGSGLGLSMVYGFAKQSGGHLRLHSEAGHGTTVKLYLPTASSDTAAVGGRPEAAPPRSKGETLLVVEDDPDVRDLAVTMLAALGYVVIAAANAKAAHEALDDRGGIDLLLSDVILTGGTGGPELAREIKARYPDVKVLFMSGYAPEAANRNGLLRSDANLLSKPFRLQDLAEKIREVLES